MSQRGADSPLRFVPGPAENRTVTEPFRSHSPAVGTLSPDGSRVWDGQYWKLNGPAPPSPAIEQRSNAADPSFELNYRGAHVGGVIVASMLGVVMSHLGLNFPALFSGPATTVEGALNQLGISILIWTSLTFLTLVLVLSVGRQGIDVLLVRSMIVAFVIGVGFFILLPLWYFSFGKWLLVTLMAGGTFAVLYGPILALFAAVANLLWYRSLRSLRPQLGIFHRRRSGTERV